MTAPRVSVRRGPTLPGIHPTILVSIDGGADVQCCGYSWCIGECAIPAAVITVDEREHKLYGDMVAMGPVVQRWRVEWAGERYRIPEEHAEELCQKWWR